MRSALRFHAAASFILLAAVTPRAADRPRYGGTLRIEISASVATIDPAALAPGNAAAQARARLEAMVFDRLVTLDATGQAAPQLATSWSQETDNRKWQFILRTGVKLSNGTDLTARDAADSLRAANSDWQIAVSGNSLIIETRSPLPGLPAELALARNSILRRGSDGAPLGSGPFRVAEWTAGRRAIFEANDDYWGGRPFVDSVEVQMARVPRDQLIDLELGRADSVELGIDEVRRAAQENLRTIASSPVELMALVFAPGKPAGNDSSLRQALALTIDRATIRDVLLQKQAESAGGLLPQWLSGYAFLFPIQRDLAEAKRLRAGMPSAPALNLGYDAGDPVARAVAERIALNARDAGLNVRTISLNGETSATNADARIVLEPVISADYREALAAMADWLHDPAAATRALSAAPGEAYEIERALVETHRIIPLFHLPRLTALGPLVHEWTTTPFGDWRLESVWLEAEKP